MAGRCGSRRRSGCRACHSPLGDRVPARAASSSNDSRGRLATTLTRLTGLRPHPRARGASGYARAMADQVTVRCCIAGGGPAGMMLGHLLARAGVDVLVLEKHADFLRDFRGDTIHPSTLEVMRELGLLEELLTLPHQKAPRIFGYVGGLTLTVADFSHLPVRCPYVAFMPQWDFLNFLAQRAARY